jgi:hypothetical protein
MADFKGQYICPIAIPADDFRPGGLLTLPPTFEGVGGRTLSWRNGRKFDRRSLAAAM